MRRLLSLAAAIVLFAAGVLSSELRSVKRPHGFDNEVYSASMALYGSLPAHMEGVMPVPAQTHFLCTVTSYEKVDGGYMLIGAGHCTGEANSDDLPKGMQYSVSDNIGTERTPVVLLKAVMSKQMDNNKDYLDYAVYYMPTSRSFPVIPLGDENDVEIGSDTVHVNFSLGEKMTKQLAKGYVASEVAQVPSVMAGMMLVTQFDSHGASGSSIVSEKTHKIIGLVIAGYDGTTTPTIVIPMSKIKKLVQAIHKV